VEFAGEGSGPNIRTIPSIAATAARPEHGNAIATKDFIAASKQS
jgi:hypothetical protein